MSYTENLLSTYSVFFKSGHEPDRFTGKRIQSSILEFWGMENSSKTKHLVEK